MLDDNYVHTPTSGRGENLPPVTGTGIFRCAEAKCTLDKERANRYARLRFKCVHETPDSDAIPSGTEIELFILVQSTDEAKAKRCTAGRITLDKLFEAYGRPGGGVIETLANNPPFLFMSLSAYADKYQNLDVVRAAVKDDKRPPTMPPVAHAPAPAPAEPAKPAGAFDDDDILF